MARKATGAIVEHGGKDGLTYRALRFTAYGKRRFVSLGPVSASEAQRELRHTLADIERGRWTPRVVEAPPEPEPCPTFHAFAEEWWTLNEAQWRPATHTDYRWRLEKHLLPYFAEFPVDAISFETIERYIAAKLAEDEPLSPRCINMTLMTLGAILERARKRKLIEHNPARDPDLRVRERKPARGYLDSAAQIAALLDAAAELDAEAINGRKHVQRRAILATLVFAGLRIGELCELRWRDVDLAGGWLSVGRAKTDAGIRRVKVRGALRDTLLAIKPTETEPDAYVFATARGGQQNPSNVRNRILAPACEKATAALLRAGGAPLPHLTPHGCRRTFASVLYALAETPPVVMAEMGHTTPELALGIYAQAMRRDELETARLRALVEGGEVADGAAQLAAIGRRADRAGSEAPKRHAA